MLQYDVSSAKDPVFALVIKSITDSEKRGPRQLIVRDIPQVLTFPHRLKERSWYPFSYDVILSLEQGYLSLVLAQWYDKNVTAAEQTSCYQTNWYI
mgnify:CR=1 FL=1